MAGGVTVTTQVYGLHKPRRGKSSDSKSKPKGKIESKISKGSPRAQATGGGGAAAVTLSLLTEKEDSRGYREEYKTIKSSDGLFVLQYKELISIDYVTNNGDVIKFKYLPLEEE